MTATTVSIHTTPHRMAGNDKRGTMPRIGTGIEITGNQGHGTRRGHGRDPEGGNRGTVAGTKGMGVMMWIGRGPRGEGTETAGTRLEAEGEGMSRVGTGREMA